MDKLFTFPDRAAFRAWLQENGAASEGVWLLFGKKGGPKTLSAAEALEEALCYGWIDGQMQSLDAASYKKYFARRTAKSNWSEKNKALVQKLEAVGSMTALGRAKIAEAKENGQWDAPKPPAATEEQRSALTELLRGQEPAFTNFSAMPPSVQKTYTRAYFDAKTEAGREKRLAWMLDRLHRNLKPM